MFPYFHLYYTKNTIAVPEANAVIPLQFAALQDFQLVTIYLQFNR